MSENARQLILNKIQQALKTSVPVPFPDLTQETSSVFPTTTEDLAVIFAEQFTQLQGQFSFCLSLTEVCQQLLILSEKRGIRHWYCNNLQIRQSLEKAGWNLGWHETLPDCHASITSCEALVARTGTMVLSSTASGGRTPSVYAPVHVCLAWSQQLVYDISHAISMLQQRYNGGLPSQLSFASGPSRTADIEKTLVTGVHGPKEVFCFLIDQA